MRLEIPDVILVEPVVFPDIRGFFAELYKRTDFLAGGVPHDFVQVSLSKSRRGVVRGLHYQLKPMEQGKLVTVVKGRVVDVAVDVRRGSPWFGKYVMVELSADNPSFSGYRQALPMAFKPLRMTRYSYTYRPRSTVHSMRGVLPGMTLKWAYHGRLGKT